MSLISFSKQIKRIDFTLQLILGQGKLGLDPLT